MSSLGTASSRPLEVGIFMAFVWWVVRPTNSVGSQAIVSLKSTLRIIMVSAASVESSICEASASITLASPTLGFLKARIVKVPFRLPILVAVMMVIVKVKISAVSFWLPILVAAAGVVIYKVSDSLRIV